MASEVFDHTSVIRFLESRFGVREPNISEWRRAVCGDLTSCFDFARPDDRSFLHKLPRTTALSERAMQLKEIRPSVPTLLTPPVQEAGLRRRRATPYRLDAHLAGSASAPTLKLANQSSAPAAVFHLYRRDRLDADPERFTVGAGDIKEVSLPITTGLFLIGPNGFHRAFEGTERQFAGRFTAREGTLSAELQVSNWSSVPLSVKLRDLAYGQPERSIAIAPAQQVTVALDLRASHGWYDFYLSTTGQTLRLAGHIEDGQPSYSDPAAEGAARLTLV